MKRDQDIMQGLIKEFQSSQSKLSEALNTQSLEIRTKSDAKFLELTQGLVSMQKQLKDIQDVVTRVAGTVKKD